MYRFPGSDSYLILGRAEDDFFGEPESGDGDYYQGFGVTIGDILHARIEASVVNAWLDDASPRWDVDGIQESWQNMGDVFDDMNIGAPGDESGEVAYSLLAEVESPIASRPNSPMSIWRMTPRVMAMAAWM